MANASLIPAGDFRTSYAADTTIFPTRTSRNMAILGVVLVCFAPLVLSGYWLSILIQIGIFGIAALGLNILVGFTGQISIGHAAFFLLGAYTSAYLNNHFPIPVFFAIPLAGLVTAARDVVIQACKVSRDLAALDLRAVAARQLLRRLFHALAVGANAVAAARLPLPVVHALTQGLILTFKRRDLLRVLRALEG